MADEKKEKRAKKSDDEAKPFVPRTATELQKMQFERLMKDPDKAVNIPEQRKKQWKPTDPKEFVRFVMGSSAGAGSGEFHVYRATRRREYNRQEYIDNKAKQEEKQDEYHKKLEDNARKAEEKTSKKRAKRQKKKQKKMEAKRRKETESTTQDNEVDKEVQKEESSEEEEEETEEPHFIIKGR